METFVCIERIGSEASVPSLSGSLSWPPTTFPTSPRDPSSCPRIHQHHHHWYGSTSKERVTTCCTNPKQDLLTMDEGVVPTILGAHESTISKREHMVVALRSRCSCNIVCNIRLPNACFYVRHGISTRVDMEFFPCSKDRWKDKANGSVPSWSSLRFTQLHLLH